MHEDLKWLAENVKQWGGTYGFPYIFLGDGREDYCCTSGSIFQAFTRAQWQAAREHLGLVTTGTEDEAFDAIAKKEKAFIDSSGYRWRSDITAYDPPYGTTTMPEGTFTTPDEDEAWNAMQAKQARYQDTAGEDWIDEAARTFTPEEFRGAMRLSIGKYNRRMGKKDELIKEIEKMKDYCQRWIDVEKGR